MPRIQEYLPEENAAGPQGALSPNTEQMSAAGRGLEKFGTDVEEGANAVFLRQSQMETQQAFGDVSEQRVSDIQDQLQGTQDGTWDNDSYKQKFLEWQNDQIGNYETAAGKNTFMRQSNRLLGAMLTRGVKAQAQIAANNASAQYTDNVENLATATRLAPDTLQDNLESAYEHSMDLPEAAQPHADQHAEQTLVREAILGTAQTDAGKAMKMLQNKDLASMLDPKEMDGIYGKVQAAQKAEDEAFARNEALHTKASKAAMNNYLMGNIDGVVSGTMSQRDIILNAPSAVDFETRIAFAEKAKQAQNLVQTTSPAVMHSIQDRMLLPKDDPNAIVDVSQLVKQPGLAPQEIKKLSDWYFKTPQGAAEKKNEQLMFKDIQGKLKVSGIPDQQYDNKVINSMSDYQKAKADAIANGDDPTELTNPKSDKYFPNQVRPTSPIDIIKSQADIMKAAATNTPIPPPQIVHTSPGVLPPIERKDKKTGKVFLYAADTHKLIGPKDGQ